MYLQKLQSFRFEITGSRRIRGKVQFNDPIDISKEQWMEMLSNPDVFRKEDVELVKPYIKGRRSYSF